MTTSRSPGRAPPRPGTRSLRPRAVTLSITALGRGQIAADDGNTGLGDALVELDHIVVIGRRRHGERDHERLGLGARGREVAEARRGGAPAELAPADPVEAKMDVLDHRVLGRDQAAAELRSVVLDVDDQPAPLELGQQAELTELR